MEPLRLSIKNFYAIADGVINFTKFSSALVLGYYENNVLMSNGAGKSSIFEAISWVIFNETRQTKVDDVIRWNANETLVEFEFLFGRNIYKISRRRSRVAKESSVSLFTKEGDKWINDSGSTNSETNKKILALLKIDSKIFLNSVYFKQHDISLFANSTPSDRKEIINSIMKLDRWDEYQKQAKNKLKGIKDDIEKQLRILHDNANLGIATVVNIKSTEMIENEIAELSIKQKNVQNKLHTLFEFKKERDINNLIKNREDVERKIYELKKQGKNLQLRQIELNDLLENRNNKNDILIKNILDIKNNINNLNDSITVLKDQNCQYAELDSDIIAGRIEKSKLEDTLTGLNDSSSKVNLGQCEVCFADITQANLPHIHKNRQEKEKETREQLAISNKKLNKIENEYKKRKDNKEKLDNLTNEYQACHNTLLSFQAKKKEISEELLSLENENSVIIASLRSIIDQIKIQKIEADAIDKKIAEQKINNIDNEIANVEDMSKKISHELNAKNIELGALLKEREFISQKESLVSVANDSLARLGKEKSASDQLVRFFGKEGIQAVFIESIVDELEQYANATLSYICNEPTLIRLKTQKKTGDSWQETLEIDVIMNGFHQTFESLGGGEMFRISLALRIGLSEVLVKKAGGEIKLLLLDEVDSPLDAYGSNNLFENIIKGLEKRFKILVISHNDKLKDRFSDLIVVNKTSNGSLISQT